MFTVVVKYCKKCEQEKPLTDFHVQRAGHLGRRPDCKTCRGCKGPRKVKTKTELDRKNYIRAWNQTHREHRRVWTRNYMRERRKDVHQKLRDVLRQRISKAIKQDRRPGSAVKDLGCTIGQLKHYIESKFLPGMTWENRGMRGWHVDHVKPLASFDLTDPTQFRQAVHYTNLQPLWWEDNLRKGKQRS